MEIILASTSPYRLEQLKRFGLKFRALSPAVDEEKLKSPHLKPKRLSQFLAAKKAESIAITYPKAIVIGADQLVSFKGQALGKPGSHKNAVLMLKRMSGKTHKLITSIAVIYKGKCEVKTVTAKIKMRKLKAKEIEDYVSRDNPLDCAGSYKFELSGLSLVEKMSVSDPSSLTGLPLIGLMRLLLKTGQVLPFHSSERTS